jgi:arabinogalactan endo-1,4-beta-galactosidase
MLFIADVMYPMLSHFSQTTKVSLRFRKTSACKFLGNPLSSLYTWPDGQRHMVTLLCALLQLCVGAVRQSSILILTTSVLHMRSEETTAQLKGERICC